MKKILKEIQDLKKSNVSKIINKRLKEFNNFKNKNNNEWFNELCFCLLTANSKANTAINIQKELGLKGFINKNKEELTNIIIKNKHRFHNVKANYIIHSRVYNKNIKQIIKNEKNPREWLVKNIKGFGMKESSHFLRNVGFTNYAILDRHIINLLHDHKLISSNDKNLTKNNYLRIEKVFKKIASNIRMSCSELDLYMWYIKTGKVLK